MLTPKDIENSERASGYDFVAGVHKTGHTPRWRASVGTRPHHVGEKTQCWRGPSRKTAIEAAQDYCDYKNGQSTPSLPSYPSVVIDMGNVTTHAPKAEFVKIVREKYEGPHDVYDVLFVDPLDNDRVVRRKVGITARGTARYTDICKTFGFSIKPHMPAVTYADEEKARAAETKKVAEVCADPKWTRVGKESFAPVKETTS